MIQGIDLVTIKLLLYHTKHQTTRHILLAITGISNRYSKKTVSLDAYKRVVSRQMVRGRQTQNHLIKKSIAHGNMITYSIFESLS